MSLTTELNLHPVGSTYAEESWADPAADPTAEVEDTLELGAVIGRGGLGEVIECFDRALNRTVALKRPVEATRSAAITLLREAQITSQLIHPSIPSVHSIGLGADGRPWFTMDRLHGQTLRAHLAAGTEWSMVRRVRLILRISDAIGYAHHRGVIHRDLKPDNIFVGSFGQVHVVDWGIAKIVGSADPLRDVVTSSPDQIPPGAFAGTVTYASPEQLRGAPDLDGRSDVYSLGALLHALLAGHPPVVGDKLEVVCARVLAGDRELPAADLPAPLCSILERALAVDRADRYPSVAAFAEDLEAFLDNRPVRAHDEGLLGAFARWYNRRELAITRSDKDLHVLGGATMGAFLALVAVTPMPELAGWLGAARGVGVGALGLYAVVLLCRARSIGRAGPFADGKLLSVVLVGVGAAVAATLGLHPVL